MKGVVAIFFCLFSTTMPKYRSKHVQDVKNDNELLPFCNEQGVQCLNKTSFVICERIINTLLYIPKPPLYHCPEKTECIAFRRSPCINTEKTSWVSLKKSAMIIPSAFDCKGRFGKFAYPGSDCRYYILCSPKTNYGERLRCPWAMIFDEDLHDCVSHMMHDCDRNVTECTPGEVIPVPEDCQAYRRCRKNHVYGNFYFCRNGQLFDPQKLTCVPELEAKCERYSYSIE